MQMKLHMLKDTALILILEKRFLLSILPLLIQVELGILELLLSIQ